MTDMTKLANVFEMFSCVGFRLAFIGQRGAPSERYPQGDPIPELYATGAYRGAAEAWEFFRRDLDTVFADIEHLGDAWVLDVVRRPRNAFRDEAWLSSRYTSLEEAYRAMEWLSRNDWEVLRTKIPEPNTARRLTPDEASELELYVSGIDDPAAFRAAGQDTETELGPSSHETAPPDAAHFCDDPQAYDEEPRAERTFRDEARALSTANIRAALKLIERGLETSEDMAEWAKLAGKRDAYQAELDHRELSGDVEGGEA